MNLLYFDTFHHAGPALLETETGASYGGINDPSQVSTISGDLVLSAALDGLGGYLTGSVRSGPFTFGRFTVRAKMPAGNGMWPAIWLASGSERGAPEIDVVEVPQSATLAPTVGQFSYHWTAADGTPWQVGTFATLPDLTADYHVYCLDWQRDHVTWSVDGQVVHHVEATPLKCTGRAQRYDGTGYVTDTPPVIPIHATPLALVLNNAVGDAGSWPGAPDDTTVFPNQMRVDFVRIEQ